MLKKIELMTLHTTNNNNKTNNDGTPSKGKRMKKRTTANSPSISPEERVSLIGKDGKPSSPYQPPKSNHQQPWTFPRLIRYMSLTVMAALVTFLLVRREERVLQWEQYHSLLEPDAKERRCYVS